MIDLTELTTETRNAEGRDRIENDIEYDFHRKYGGNWKSVVMPWKRLNSLRRQMAMCEGLYRSKYIGGMR